MLQLSKLLVHNEFVAIRYQHSCNIHSLNFTYNINKKFSGAVTGNEFFPR